MPDPYSTIWAIDPHTLAKHQILEEYLKAWFPILSKWEVRILYLDGFAGPGTHSNGEEGSPIIAIRTAVQHQLAHKFNQIGFYFIEKDRDRATSLESVVRSKFPTLAPNLTYEVQGAEFAPTLESVLDGLEKTGAKLAPTLAFLDPFGFSGLPMRLIARVLSYKKCEVLITFMAGFVNRFTDELREETLDELFGTPDWRNVRKMTDPETRQKFLLGLYVGQLKHHGATQVRTFEMRGDRNQLIYHLVFATKHLRGLEVMKEAMFKVDRRGTFRFSDYTDAGQSFLVDYSTEEKWVPQAAEMVWKQFRGRLVDIDAVHQFVTIETPFVFRKSILRYLEASSPSRIAHVSDRKRSQTYPDGCAVSFSI